MMYIVPSDDPDGKEYHVQRAAWCNLEEAAERRGVRHMMHRILRDSAFTWICGFDVTVHG